MILTKNQKIWMDPTPNKITSGKKTKTYVVYFDKLAPPTKTTTSTARYTALGPDGFAAGKKGV